MITSALPSKYLIFSRLFRRAEIFENILLENFEFFFCHENDDTVQDERMNNHMTGRMIIKLKPFVLLDNVAEEFHLVCEECDESLDPLLAYVEESAYRFISEQSKKENFVPNWTAKCLPQYPQW